MRAWKRIAKPDSAYGTSSTPAPCTTKVSEMSRKAVRLLSALELLPLEKCTPDAAEWRQEIEDVIRDLQGRGLPPDDPLRYDEDGNLLSEEMLQKKLKIIIDSWPNWSQMSDRQRRDYGRKKSYSGNR